MQEEIRDIYYKKFRAFKLQYEILYKWMNCDIYHKTLEETLLAQNIHSVMIYGLGEMGGLIYDKLKNTQIEIVCFIDAFSPARQYFLEEIDVLKPREAKNLQADLVIISLAHIAESIKKDLKEAGVETPIESIENIIMDM
jgi:FlaA1/EpsC-like NDP-sugar epimerase